MLSAKRYKQKWLRFKYENPSPTKEQIWEFQRSLLSPEEQILAVEQRLILSSDDPRSWALDESDRAYDEAPEK